MFKSPPVGYDQGRTFMQDSTSSTRQAYFTHILFRSVATVALSGASSLIIPPELINAYEEKLSTWQPEV